MPEITVWPVSSSYFTTNVGSSSASLPRPVPSLSWSAFVFGSTATEITGVGKLIDSRTIGFAGLGERVAGGRVLQPDHRDDVAGERRLHVLAVVGVHLEDAADPLLAVLRGVLDVRAGAKHARVHAHVREPADVRVGHDLEHEAGERLRVVGLALGVLTLRVCPSTGGTSVGAGR